MEWTALLDCGADPEILGAVLSLFLSLRPRGCAIDVGRLAGGNATLDMFSHTWKDFGYDVKNAGQLSAIFGDGAHSSRQCCRWSMLDEGSGLAMAGRWPHCSRV